MADVGQELYQEIRDEFQSSLNKDKELARIQSRIDKEKADFADIYKYADRIGQLASEILINCLTEDKLPGGVLYWNIAQKTIKPLFEYIHQIINEKAAAVQKYIDSSSGIGINTVSGPFPEDRINDLIQKLVDTSVKEAEERGKSTDE